MSLRVTVLPEARQDILTGRTFFERQRAGLGRTFASAVLAVLNQIGAFPEMYAEVGPGVRAAGVRRFGYVVYYRLGRDGVEVLAVLHGGRDPNVWQGRATPP